MLLYKKHKILKNSQALGIFCFYRYITSPFGLTLTSSNSPPYDMHFANPSFRQEGALPFDPRKFVNRSNWRSEEYAKWGIDGVTCQSDGY